METRGYIRLIAAPALAALALLACAPPFPKQMMEKVDRSISFQDLRKDPERYQGKVVMLAGIVIDSKNAKDGTYIEVLQKPADAQGEPVDTDETGGRFIIFSEQFLDSAVYHKGRALTVIGEVTGRKVLSLGEVEYQYPVVRPKAMHLWEPYRGPRVYFGIGVFHQF